MPTIILPPHIIKVVSHLYAEHCWSYLNAIAAQWLSLDLALTLRRRHLEANDYLTKAIQIRELLFLGITFRDHRNADTLSSLFSFSLLACLDFVSEYRVG